MEPIKYYMMTVAYQGENGLTGQATVEVNGDERFPDPMKNAASVRDCLRTLGFAISKALGVVLAQPPAILFVREIEPSPEAEDEGQYELPLEGGAA